MKKGASLLVAILIAAIAVTMFKQSLRDSRNRATLDRAMYGDTARPGTR